MEQKQEIWLARFTRGKVCLAALDVSGSDTKDLAEAKKKYNDEMLVAKGEEVARKRQAAEMARSVAVVNDAKQQVIDGLTMKFEVDGKKSSTRDKDGDATKAFDSDEASRITSNQDVKGAYSKAYLKAMNNFRPVVEESARLRELTIKRYVWGEEKGKTKAEDGKKPKIAVENVVPLFEDADIMRDFYTPLVRELVIPETFVPDRYSATQKMLDGSTEAYIDECREKGKEPGHGLAALGKGVVSAAGTAVAGALGSTTDAGEIVEGVALAIGAGIDGVVTLNKGIERGQFDIDTWEAVGDSVAAAVGQIAGGAINNANQGDSYGQMISYGLHAFAIDVRVVKWAQERAKNPNAQFPWGDLVSEVMKAGGAALTSQSDSSSEETTSDKLGISGASLTAFGNTLKSGVGQLQGLTLETSPKAWTKALAKVFATAVAEGEKATISAEANIVENAQPNITNVQTNTINAQAQSVSDMVDTTREQGDPAIDAAADKLFGEDQDPKERRKKRREEDQKSFADAEEALKAEKADYQKSLDRLGMMADEQTDEDFKSIAKLITKMQNDRKIIEAVAKVAQGGAAVAAHFFAPMKAAGALVSFAINTHAACERALALMDWMDSHQDAMKSVSPYASAIQNFVKNQGDQLTHHTVQAVLNVVEAACAAAECGFPPVKAATAAATAAVMLEQTIYQFVQQQQLRNAWKTTKAAMENPGNRKLGLIARKMNPTLAKYTIAYGAVVEKSPTAIAAMSRCGLDRETLAHKDSNIRQVKTYLETLYNEDGVLLGPVPQGPGKTPMPKPALTEKTWLTTIALWQKEHSLGGDPPGSVRLGLLQFAKLDAVDPESLDQDHQKVHFEKQGKVLSALEAAFSGYEPRTGAGQEIKGADRIIEAYADLAGSGAELAQQKLDGLAVDDAKKKETEDATV